MKKLLSSLLMVAISVLVLFCYRQNTGENMTFCVIGEDGSFYLYHLDDEMNPVLLLNADYIAYKDKTAVYLENDGFRWTLHALRTDSDTPIQLAEGDALTDRPVGFQIKIQDGHAYIPVDILDERKSVVDHYLLECALNGKAYQQIYGLNLDLWNNFHVQNGNVYYIEMVESEPDRLMCYDLKTGKTTCLTRMDVVFFSAGSYLDRNVLWELTQDGNLSDPDTNVYATGYSLKNGTETRLFLNDYKTTDDTNFWVNDGFLYFFRDRRLCEDGKGGMVADLWRINTSTGKETCVHMELPYDNNFPPDIFFGRNGLVLVDEIYDGEDYVSTLKYIRYDGSETETVSID